MLILGIISFIISHLVVAVIVVVAPTNFDTLVVLDEVLVL
jgi:hypothetical protein